jgi:hypothetical protein
MLPDTMRLVATDVRGGVSKAVGTTCRKKRHVQSPSRSSGSWAHKRPATLGGGLGAPAEPFRRQLPLAGHKSGWFQKDGAQRRRRELALAAPSRGKSMVAYSALRNRLVHYETGDLMSARRLRRGDRWNLNSGKSA